MSWYRNMLPITVQLNNLILWAKLTWAICTGLGYDQPTTVFEFTKGLKPMLYQYLGKRHQNPVHIQNHTITAKTWWNALGACTSCVQASTNRHIQEVREASRMLNPSAPDNQIVKLTAYTDWSSWQKVPLPKVYYATHHIQLYVVQPLEKNVPWRSCHVCLPWIDNNHHDRALICSTL